jgi:hypothetical protein
MVFKSPRYEIKATPLAQKQAQRFETKRGWLQCIVQKRIAFHFGTLID